jgi:intracellular protein transport protein USO1
MQTQSFVRQPELKMAILQAMIPPPPESGPAPPVTPLLRALITPPSTPPDLASFTSTQFASLLFASLLRGAPDAKALARDIVPPRLDAHAESGGQFFVPADASGAPPPPPAPVPVEDEDEPQPLLAILSEHLSLALLQRAKPETSSSDSRLWDRLVAGYLALLSQWLWDDAASVREFLNAGALGMLVEPVNAPEGDGLVPGLCAFVLGLCYEYNREPGEITRFILFLLLPVYKSDKELERQYTLFSPV